MPPTEPADGPAPTPDELNIHQVDARTLRGLAHPMRIRLLNALREFGPATASGLAERLGESSGATSYHLRQLAAYGFVEDDPTRGKGRERWWKSAHEGTAFGPTTEFMNHTDPEVRGAIGVVLHEVASVHAQELSTWLGTMREWPEEWQRGMDVSDFKVRLTPELSLELAERIHALVDDYRGRVPEGTEGSAVVRTHLHMFPRPTD
ncbi:ArsR/SmtB family transcription factor [Streptomyces flavovirens]|uniref:ArsR/SmtB family transcription factor n=1 Tax=Streptomyces TaxID=1883 RepID=UPI00081B9AD3|nr:MULTISPECIES: helix-turn-helix domain-containing protein [unclassified Streptomyces]MYU37159.1 helix-turn-helix domain-containing protein [Streptomyces sp. SID8358]MYX72364.1 helix-turn-helix domain-containing protein [Streptomyces sp. SID3915]SCE05392.1 transcriptional regulator, ArsR family [Streptomyces sp. BpilaLS-43]